MKRQAVKVMKWIGVVVLVLGIAVAVFVGYGKRALRKEYEALEADGRPIRPEQVIPAQIPDSENAALIYKAVVLQMQAIEAGNEGFIAETGELAQQIIDGKADDEGLTRFGELMKRDSVHPIMAQLRLATLKNGCRYDLDYTAGAGLLLPHISDLRNLSRILCAQALLAASEGKREESWNLSIDALRLANALREEPILVSQLVRIAQFEITADTIEALTKDSLPSKEQHAELLSLLAGFEDKKPFLRAIDGERILFGEWAFTLSINEFLEANGMGSTPLHFALALLYRTVRNHDHAAYLRAMHKYSSPAVMPFSITQGEQLDESVLRDIPRYCFGTRMLLSALGSARTRFLSLVSQARVTRVGLMAIRQAGNSPLYPEKIQGIAATDLIDPFTNTPLVYRKTETGFVVYSVGPNRKDDGGVIAQEWREGDIVWTYTP